MSLNSLVVTRVTLVLKHFGQTAVVVPRCADKYVSANEISHGRLHFQLLIIFILLRTKLCVLKTTPLSLEFEEHRILKFGWVDTICCTKSLLQRWCLFKARALNVLQQSLFYEDGLMMR